MVEAAEPRLDRSFPVLGEIRTRHRAELAVGADGPIVKLDALEGARVREGDLLVQVDASLPRAELGAAEAAVQEAQVAVRRATADLERYGQVSAAVLAATEVDRVTADVAAADARRAVAEAAVASIRARIARHAIRAPFDGVVVRRRADPGDWVTPGRILVELASVQDLDILVDVDSALAGRLSEGDSAMLRLGDELRPARIDAVVPVLDPETRTARVRLAPSTHAGLLPGASVTVVFDTTAALESGARVPRDAVVLAGDGAAQVVLVRDGKAEPRQVRVLVEGTDALLISDVRPGDVVVVRGNESLRPGQAVRIVEAEE